MSIKQCCSLCCNTCSDYKQLQNKEGEGNEIYEITVKYFDPRLLTEDGDTFLSVLNVLCQVCWSHIRDFHEFQQTILKSRMSWDDKVNFKQLQTFPEIKMEREVHIINPNYTENDDDYKSDQDNVFEELNPHSEFPKVKMETEYPTIETNYTENDNYKNDQEDIAFEVFNAHSAFPEVKMEKEVHIIDTNYTENDDDYKNDQEDNVENSNPHSTESCDLKTETYSIFDNNSRDSILNKPEEQHIENNLINTVQESSGAYDKNKKEIVKSRRARKAKNASKYYSENIIEAAEKDNRKKTSQSASINKEKGTSAFNIQKIKDSDTFISEWKPELICDICSISTTNYDELRKHFKEKHTTRLYIKCCERKFFRRFTLVNHIQLHLNPETHKCDICGKTFSTKHILKTHKKVMHEDTKKFKCDKCEKLFKQKATLERHLLTHVTGNKDFICAECGKGYAAEQLLKLHIKYVHNVDRVCNECGKTIHGFRALQKHLMKHAGIEHPKFPCDICGLKLTSSNGLKRHKAAYHNDGSTIYVCGVCGKEATSEHALRSHKRLVHAEERKYKCTYCDKAFKRPTNLREHIATHTGQDLYQCPHCPQTFKVSANMHHHRKRLHPLEWEEGRRNRLQYPKVNINQVKKQVVM